jgi:N-acetylglutamate synthase-like GNAT family acetyltransferase
MTITIEEVAFGSGQYKTLLGIRYQVLRKPIGMELREKDTELDNTEYHIAAFDSGKIIGCVLLRPLNGDSVKLRQMAVLDAYQRQGIGARLVTYAEGLASARGFKAVETNARKTAQGFYKKLGYCPAGDYFMEVSLHTLKMYKTL